MAANHYLKTLILDTNARYFGISILDLMERAGRGVADFIAKKFGQKKKIAIFCGLGNNGGDGFVAARHLMKNNEVTVFLIWGPEEIKTKEAKINFEKLKITNCKLQVIVNPGIQEIKGVLAKARIENPALTGTPGVLAKARFDVVVDALFGVGIKGKLKEPYISVIRLMNKMCGKKVAIDIPSPGFKADFTVSMHYPKVPSAHVVDIGLGEVENKTGPGEVKALYRPPFNSHKGQNGQLMIIAGSERYHGAPLLATRMASKIVDLVFFSSVPENNELIRKMRSKLCEFIVVPREEVKKFIKRCDAVLIGPGMGMSEETKKITDSLLKQYPNKRFVLDADALKVVDLRLIKSMSLRSASWRRSNPIQTRDRRGLWSCDDIRCILTPHAGEFQTLFKIKATPQNVAKMAKKYKCIIVLKGPVDVICDGRDRGSGRKTALETICSSGRYSTFAGVICKKDYAGNAGLTKGGTGDVLAGLIAALACKNDLFLATCAGTFLLGLAGERLFKKVSYYYNPSDLISEIPKTVKWCESF